MNQYIIGCQTISLLHILASALEILDLSPTMKEKVSKWFAFPITFLFANTFPLKLKFISLQDGIQGIMLELGIIMHDSTWELIHLGLGAVVGKKPYENKISKNSSASSENLYNSIEKQQFEIPINLLKRPSPLSKKLKIPKKKKISILCVINENFRLYWKLSLIMRKKQQNFA